MDKGLAPTISLVDPNQGTSSGNLSMLFEACLLTNLNLAGLEESHRQQYPKLIKRLLTRLVTHKTLLFRGLTSSSSLISTFFQRQVVDLAQP